MNDELGRLLELSKTDDLARQKLCSLLIRTGYSPLPVLSKETALILKENNIYCKIKSSDLERVRAGSNKTNYFFPIRIKEIPDFLAAIQKIKISTFGYYGNYTIRKRESIVDSETYIDYIIEAGSSFYGIYFSESGFETILRFLKYIYEIRGGC